MPCLNSYKLLNSFLVCFVYRGHARRSEVASLQWHRGIDGPGMATLAEQVGGGHREADPDILECLLALLLSCIVLKTRCVSSRMIG